MGQLEEKVRKRNRKANLKKFILSSVMAVGLLGVVMVAPNVLSAIKKAGFSPIKRQKESIKLSRDRLVKKGLLKYEGSFLKLTQKGEDVLRRLELVNFQLKKPRRWDGKWRVLIFDIPEKRKMVREQIRTMLIRIGFIRLQDSVWVYPYDCEDVTVLLKADFKVGKDLLYMIVESIEYDTALRKHFSLGLS